ncbi:MAG: hypothetical protein RJA70_1676 [Pseudomonadota bacterium]
MPRLSWLLPVGFLAAAFGLGVRDVTLVPLYIQLLVAVGGAVAGYSVSTVKPRLAGTLPVVLGAGGLAFGAFFGLNYFFAGATPTPVVVPIVGRGCRNCGKADRSLHRPTVQVLLDERQLEFDFDAADFSSVERAQALTLLVHPGGLGFKVIENWRLSP